MGIVAVTVGMMMMMLACMMLRERFPRFEEM